MRVYIQSGNHDNTASIGDMVLFLKCALQDCGHTAYLADELVAGELNIVLEHFVEQRHMDALIEGRAAGARIVLIGTEPILGGSFNAGIDANGHYGNSPYWTARYENFVRATALADAVWVLAESMLPSYAALVPDRPVRFLPYGHVAGFATVRQRPEADRDIDFYFSGTLTDHRKRILAALCKRHVVVYNSHTTPEYLRQDQLSRAHVCLSLKLSPQNTIPSVSRSHFHLQNRSFVLQESYALSCPLDPFVLQAPSDEFVEWAVASLQIANRRDVANAAHERFKRALPMKQLLPPLLDEALRSAAAVPRRHDALAA